ncbi:hypothetical protein C8J57DRAFT_1725959 [Mycena rebaudengoi]|nr:hypothetical protein C8J57DRAFT_1725959 [Mycena rebaudengoi]
MGSHSYDRWFRIPAEIADQIAGHNDVPSLRAMALVSKTMRSSAINHLFSFIHFACAADISFWNGMLDQTPTLGSVVKKELDVVYPLDGVSILPMIISMPSVKVVEWLDYSGHFTLDMQIAYMALFSNLDSLHLKFVSFDSFVDFTKLLAACGRVKGLSLEYTGVGDDELESESDGDELESDSDDSDGPAPDSIVQQPRVHRVPSVFDLTELEELNVNSTEAGEDFLVRLIKQSPPARLKRLALGSFSYIPERQQIPCSALAMEKLLRLGAASLVHLAIQPTFPKASQNRDFLEMFRRLPAFPELRSLTIWLGPNRQAEWMLAALAAAPNLTTITFRLTFDEGWDEEQQREGFNEVLRVVFPWGGFESMKTVLIGKFPLLCRVAFHFGAFRDSDIHFRRGVRRRMERRLKERLEETGADIAEYLELEWLDEDYNLLAYSKMNGKPLWTVERHSWSREPETEASDWESEKSDDEEYPPRVWTAEHERQYREEMMAEIRGEVW